MKRIWLPAFLALIVGFSAAVPPAQAQTSQEQVIAEARDVVGTFSNKGDYVADVRDLVHRSRAVLIVPELVKGGFIFGAQGGTGVLLVHEPGNKWSYPAFYNMGAASFGLQIGVEVSKIVLIIMTDRALNAVLQNEFKIGAEAGIAIATLGTGAEASTTTNAGADIYAMAVSKGLFGGVAVQGGILKPYDSWNAAFYGHPVSAGDIVLRNAVTNPAADRLRSALAHQ